MHHQCTDHHPHNSLNHWTGGRGCGFEHRRIWNDLAKRLVDVEGFFYTKSIFDCKTVTHPARTNAVFSSESTPSHKLRKITKKPYLGFLIPAPVRVSCLLCCIDYAAVCTKTRWASDDWHERS